MTKDEAIEWMKGHDPNSRFFNYYYRAVLLHGTDAGNHSPGSREWFKFAHRKGRRIERDKLRPHLVMDEDYWFDDSAYKIKYKGVWWDIY